jgi:hypothetical protein
MAEEEPQRRRRPWSLTQSLILLLGVCCLLSVSVNFLHGNSIAHHTTEMALAMAMKEFTDGYKSSRASVKKAVAALEEEFRELEKPNEGEEWDQEEPREEEPPVEEKRLAADDSSSSSLLAGLNCGNYGGPSPELAQEMVYWSDIPLDAQYKSPFYKQRRYMTFEPDGGGWNNIRMAMETVVGLAVATGRTLVLPPEQRMYLLRKDTGKQRTHFSFAHFFPMLEIAQEHIGLQVLTMDEFLKAEAMTGNLRDKTTGKVSFPPNNQTNWDGSNDVKVLKEWLRNVTHTPLWNPGHCLAAFPASGDIREVENLQNMMQQIAHTDEEEFLGRPVPVDASTVDRMAENRAGRKELCVYDHEMQQELVVHFMCYHKMRIRLLVHFYAFLFFEDWKQDLWMKRFIRDHVRYVDEIQCAAARVVGAVRERARKRGGNGDFDAFHIRRGDFQYKKTRISAEEIYENVHDKLTGNKTVYIATDERDKKFFDPLREHYDIVFLDDFHHELEGVNSNLFGMLDQLIASRGHVFVGCWFSTFTGYITRIRGYHSVKNKEPGYEKGELPTTFYYATKDKKLEMLTYTPVRRGFFNREFPTSWRDIDKGIEELAASTTS